MPLRPNSRIVSSPPTVILNALITNLTARGRRLRRTRKANVMRIVKNPEVPWEICREFSPELLPLVPGSDPGIFDFRNSVRLPPALIFPLILLFSSCTNDFHPRLIHRLVIFFPPSGPFRPRLLIICLHN